MCGIAGYIGDNQASKELLYILGKLEYRGYDSAGIATIDGQLKIGRGLGNLGKVATSQNLKSFQGNTGIGHVRWATHGGVSIKNAHPLTDCNNKIAIVHNGVIDNYLELKNELIDKGHIFKSDTDSEVIAHLIEDTPYSFPDAFTIALGKLDGSFAIVACHVDYPDILMCAKKDMPLIIGLNTNEKFITSDIIALPKVDRFIQCDEHKTYTVRKENVHQTAPLDSDWCLEINEGVPLDYLPQPNSKGSFEHFMLKEIHEQPETFKQALKQDTHKLIGVALDIYRARNVILTACGTSRYAAIIGRYLMSKLGSKFSEVIVGSELHHFEDSFDNNTLVIAVSQSGETADVVLGLKLAKERGSKIISIVNKPYSSLERMSDVTLTMNCGEEVAVASTKAFISELAIFYLITMTMANKLEVKELENIPLADCFKDVELIEQVAGIIKDCQHIYFIGKGINFAVSGECALKLKEVTYLHAESMSAGELKHGTLSLIEQGTPVIGVCPSDYTYKETITNLYEAKARGAIIIGISDKNHDIFDYWLKVPQVKDIYYPIVTTIIGQLLAYYTAIARDLNPDQPKNLSKSVTVR